MAAARESKRTTVCGWLENSACRRCQSVAIGRPSDTSATANIRANQATATSSTSTKTNRRRLEKPSNLNSWSDWASSTACTFSGASVISVGVLHIHRHPAGIHNASH
jgi:hypothetical protein